MQFSFEIGEREKNTVHFHFNQLFGQTKIAVNGREIRRTRRLFSEPLRDEFEFTVGENEPFLVRIEKERRLLIASRYRVFINRRLLAVHQGP